MTGAACRPLQMNDFLHNLAELHGLLPAYSDAAGRHQSTPPEVLSAVLAALGVPATNDDEVRAGLREARLRPYRQHLEPVIVHWDKRPAKAAIHLPERIATKPLRMRLHLEPGATREFTPRLRTIGKVTVDGQGFITKQFTVPALPFGYHQLEIATWDATHHALILSAPAL